MWNVVRWSLATGLTGLLLGLGCGGQHVADGGVGQVLVRLSPPRLVGEMSVEEALARRRSVRSYLDEPLTPEELGQLLWAAQGITAEWGGRTAPSAGATYPLEVYAVVGKVEGLPPGVYRYLPEGHALVLHKRGDVRADLAREALGQPWVRTAPLVLLIAANYERTTARYGERGIRYVHMEVGHVGQNVYLQAEALGLGTVTVGAFYDAKVKALLEIQEEPLYLMPVGRPAR